MHWHCFMPRLSVLDPRPPPDLLTARQMLELAEEFRALAAAAETPELRQALTTLAVRYEMTAAMKEKDELAAVRH